MRRGLTLIELIVVMAILVLLIAMAVPSLKNGKESGVTIVCTNNLKHLSLITSIYCEDNICFPQGFCSLPDCIHTTPEGGFVGNNSYDWFGWYWFHFLEIEDLSKDGILWCPARKRMNPPISENILCSNYGMNYSIAKRASIRQIQEFRGPSLRKTELRQPSQTLVYADSGYALISWKAVAEGFTEDIFDITTRETSFYLPGLEMNKEREINPQQQEDAIKGRHPHKTVSAAFADAHVQKEKAESFFVQMNEEGRIQTLSAYIWSPGE